MGPSQRRLTSWEMRCHGHDFGLLLKDGVESEDSDRGSQRVSERDAAVVCFSETEVF